MPFIQNHPSGAILFKKTPQERQIDRVEEKMNRILEENAELKKQLAKVLKTKKQVQNKPLNRMSGLFNAFYALADAVSWNAP